MRISAVLTSNIFHFREFHMVTAKRPVYSPNIPEKFDKSDLVQNTDDGFYTNHIFDVPEVTKSRYHKRRTDISHGLAPLKGVKPVHDKGHFRIDESAVMPNLLPPIPQTQMQID